MVSYPAFYEGARYGLEPKYSEDSTSLSPFVGYNLPSGSFGFPSNPQTANQIDAVSKKISTGARTIEVSGVSIGGGPAMDLIDNIPKQQFKEIARLKKLAGVDLTFHGPLVEPTGVSRQGWDESQRMHAERQMFSAVERAHDLGKNTVVTFHSSNGLPEPETYEYENGKPVLKEVFVVDERNGRFQQVGPPKKDYFTDKELDPYQEIEKQNEESWNNQLQNISFHAHNGEAALNQVFKRASVESPELKAALGNENITELYKMYKDGKEDKIREAAGKPEFGELLINTMQEIGHGDIYFRDAYGSLRNLYNTAYDAAQRNKNNENAKIRNDAQDALKKLDKFKEEIAPKLKNIEDPRKIEEFGKEIARGVNVLLSIAPPRNFKPLKEFAIDKASDTFANIAFQAYEKFKKDDSAPIISIENPPVGMGLSSGQDLRDLVKESRRKFVEQAKEKGLSESKAQEQAAKLIGVTWDVGHINMMRKHGAQEKHILAETEKIAPYVKHIHLSDNFGLEHTELPMGMGNVPIKEHEQILRKQFGEKFKQIKQIVETGSWFRNFNNVTPFAETLEAFGSALYPMKMASYWNGSRGGTSPYFSGYGRMLPDVNFSTYGAGFSSLPTELGGQIGGGRSRLSGAPNE